MVHDDAPDPIREALTAGHLAHLVTINPDGSPHVTIVWIGLEGDEIVSGHLPFHRKLRNVQRDPRVSLSIEVGGHNEMGLANYLVVEGRHITEGGAAGLLQRLATVYIGPDVKFHRLTTRRPAMSCGSRRTASAAPTLDLDEAVEAADRVRSHQPGERSAGD